MENDRRIQYKIGELAREAGIGVETIRFYEREGLLPEPPRRRAVHHRGYRIYGDEALRRLKFIRRAKELGFTLAEIRSLLDLRFSDQTGCLEVRVQAARHLNDVEERLRDLVRIRDALTNLIDKCEAKKDVGESECPILHYLENADKKPNEQKNRLKK